MQLLSYIFIFTAAILISWKTTSGLDFVGESTIENSTIESRQHRIHMKIMFLSGRIAEIEGTQALRVTNSVRLAAG